MKRLIQFFSRRVTNDNADGTFARWACTGSAIAVLIIATVFFVRNSRDGTELLCGLGLTLVTCLALAVTGEATSRLHWATLQHQLPLRTRLGEFAGYVATFGILFGGVWQLATLPLERPEMTMGLLLILSASMAVACLGIWSTLRQVGRLKAVKP
jgi:hypothetical protein